MDPSSCRPKGCTNFKLRQFNRVVSRHYDAHLAACGLKTTQYSLLTAIASAGEIRPGDLARVLSMDASTLTRNLKPLIDSGWVEIGAGDDLRSRLIAITASGRAKRLEARAHWRAAQDAMTEHLGVANVDALHRLIDRCQALLQQLPDPDRQAA